MSRVPPPHVTARADQNIASGREYVRTWVESIREDMISNPERASLDRIGVMAVTMDKELTKESLAMLAALLITMVADPEAGRG